MRWAGSSGVPDPRGQPEGAGTNKYPVGGTSWPIPYTGGPGYGQFESPVGHQPITATASFHVLFNPEAAKLDRQRSADDSRSGGGALFDSSGQALALSQAGDTRLSGSKKHRLAIRLSNQVLQRIDGRSGFPRSPSSPIPSTRPRAGTLLGL